MSEGAPGKEVAPESNAPFAQATSWNPAAGLENVTVSPRSTVPLAGENVNASVVRTAWSAAAATPGTPSETAQAQRKATPRYTARPYPPGRRRVTDRTEIERAFAIASGAPSSFGPDRVRRRV